MKISLIISFLFLSIVSFGQNTISLKIKIDDTDIESQANDLIVKIKFKGQTDTLKITSIDGKLNIPWLYKEMNYWEVFYKGYFVNMTEYAAQVEGKSLFNEFNQNWLITIDNFPYAAITKERFTKIKKPEYAFIIKTDNKYDFWGIGKK